MPRKEFKRDPGAEDRRRRKGKKTVKNSSTAPRKLIITAKFRKQSAEAIQYRLMGYTFTQIGEEMKVDPAYAHRLVKWAMDTQPVEGADELRALMSQRLEMMLVGTLDRAFEGDSEAQDQSRRTMEFFAKLNGLYKPQKVEHSGEVQGGGNAVFIISETDARL
jgi:hypothetical protein